MRPEEMQSPENWGAIDCIEWLTHHGFMDFRETFYNNGFEGIKILEYESEKIHKQVLIVILCLVHSKVYTWLTSRSRASTDWKICTLQIGGYFGLGKER